MKRTFWAKVGDFSKMSHNIILFLYCGHDGVKVVYENSLDAGIQDESTSISIVVKVDLRLEKKKKSMKVTNIYKHEIVDTRA